MIDIDATIHLWGDKLEPSELTILFNKRPVHSHKKGELSSSSSKSSNVKNTGAWSFSTTDYVRSRNMSDHIQFISENFFSNLKVLEEQGIVESCRITIWIAIPDYNDDDANVSANESELSVDLVQTLASVRASLSFVTLRTFDHESTA